MVNNDTDTDNNSNPSQCEAVLSVRRAIIAVARQVQGAEDAQALAALVASYNNMSDWFDPPAS